MSDKKISQLPPVSTPLAGTEVLPIVQTGTTKKVTVNELKTGLAVYPAAGIAVSTGTAWSSSLPVPLTPANGGTGATTLPANNVLLGNGTSAVLAVAPGTAGNVLTSNGTTWLSTTPTGSGTVTSVGGTGTVNGISLSGTVTSSGNLTLGGALTGVNLGTQVTGTLPVANGGTGQTSYTNGQLLIGNSTGNTLTKATLTAGTGITITNSPGGITIDSTASGSGTVTSVAATVPSFLSVAGSPITTSGTLAISYSGTALPIANGGTSATTANGAINALLPSQTGNSGKVLSTDGTNTSWAAVGGSGTVTSVDVSGGTTGLTTSGGPVTASGTITLAGTLAIANGGTGETTRQAAIDALAGAVTSGQYLRGNGTDVVMSAIQAADVPTLNQNTTGTAANVTGTVAVANGGTGATTLTANNVILGNGTSAVQVVAPGANGNVLTSNGTTWTSSTPTASGTVTSVAATVPAFLSVAGSPITTSGTLAISLSGTALPVANGGTGITSFGTGVAAALGQNVTGSGSIALATSPTLSGTTLNDGYTEEVFAVSGTTPALSPTDGSIQTWTLSGNSTPTQGTWNSGQSITLMIDDGSAFTVTWTSLAVVWKTDAGVAPTLNTTGYTVITLWEVGTTIYGARVGNA